MRSERCTVATFRQGAFLLCLFVCGACASRTPCPAGALTDSASPPHACRVDGCTLTPDFDFRMCCDTHDVAYWLGGSSAQRLDADREFRACVSEKNHPLLAWLYYSGVRAGGVGFLPTPWRWGFGWDFPQSKAPGGAQSDESD